MPYEETALLIPGKAISPGLAEGRTFVHRDLLRSLDAPIAIDVANIESADSPSRVTMQTLQFGLPDNWREAQNHSGCRFATLFVF
jgi:hypothetical protein